MNGPAGYPAGAFFDRSAPWNAPEPFCGVCRDRPFQRGLVECDACGRGHVNPKREQQGDRE